MVKWLTTLADGLSMHKLKKILAPLSKFWNKIDPKDRRLIRLYLILSNVILVFCLVLLYFLTPSPEEMEELAKPLPGLEGPSSSQPMDSSRSNGEKMSSESEGFEAEPELASKDSSQESFSGPTSLLQEIDETAHRELSNIYLENRDYKKSIPHLQRLYEQGKHKEKIGAVLGETLLKSGLAEEALPYLKEAHNRDKDNVDLNRKYLKALFYSKNPKGALEKLKRLKDSNPQEPLLQLDYASLWSKAQPYHNQSEAIFSQIRSKYPNLKEQFLAYGEFQLEKGNFATAQKELEEYLKRAPLDPEGHANLGSALFFQNKIQEAEKKFKTALSIAPEDYNSWFNLGEVYGRKSYLANDITEIKRYNQYALKSYIQTLRYKPTHPQAHYEVGVLMMNNKQYKEAIQHFEKTLAKNARHQKAWMQWAVCLEVLEQYEEAWVKIQAAYEIDPLNRVISEKRKELRSKLKTEIQKDSPTALSFQSK